MSRLRWILMILAIIGIVICVTVFMLTESYIPAIIAVIFFIVVTALWPAEVAEDDEELKLINSTPGEQPEQPKQNENI